VACFEVLVARDTIEVEDAMVRQGNLIAVVVRAFLIGCAVLLVLVGCAGVRSEAPKEEQQAHTEATKQEQGRSPSAAASEEARCEKRRTFHRKNYAGFYVTNDVPGCPTGGLLVGTDGPENLWGGDGEDEIRGLGGSDNLEGGAGRDVLYGGPGEDFLCSGALNACGDESNDDVLYGGDGSDELWAGNGEEVLYGGDGNDRLGVLDTKDGGRVRLYCGEGWDRYMADKTDFVSSSCEKKWNGLVVEY
jgi:hypothetical protein